MSRPTRRDLRDRVKSAGRVRALVRRMRVVASKGVRWVLEGHEDFDGNVETDEVEVFPNVGLYARAKSGDRVEAIVAKVGGESGHPAIVATRNQDGVKRLGAVDEDETALYNSKAAVRVKPDGTIEVAAHEGTAIPLATKADLEDLRTAILGWTPVSMDGGAALKVALTTLFGSTPDWSWPDGTQKLKAE